MSEIPTLISCIKHDIEALGKSIAEMKKTHAQVLTEEWIDKEQVLTILKISSRKLQTFRDNGTLPYSQIDGKIYFKTSDVEALLNKCYNKR